MQSSSGATSSRPDPAAAFDLFTNCPTGTVQYSFATDTFHWSDEMYRIHGYEPGQIIPTFDLG